ncbi:MAG: class IV adenylate cyclase [Anaerolineae bacterium]|nr:class IV adenylate cyclase [Anaerolineae bacterium]
MTSHLTETEIKLYVPDFAPVLARLTELDAVLETPRTFERNVRYLDAAQTFMERGIVLRLRQDAKIRLTYKEPPHIQDGMMSRFEAEITVDDFDMMDIILKKLGFVPDVVYEKYRTTYQLPQISDDTEILLDEMPYGNFVEIEGEPDAIRAAMQALHLSNAPHVGMSYLSMFMHIKRVLGLEMHDLTFANFEGVFVPSAAIPVRV